MKDLLKKLIKGYMMYYGVYWNDAIDIIKDELNEERTK